MLAKFAIWFFVLVAALAAVRWRVMNVRRKLLEARSWPTATGKVLLCSLEPVGDKLGIWDYLRPRVEYEYAVAGRVYRGERLLLCGRPMFGYGPTAKAILAEYSKGASVIVHHHPERPEHAALRLDASELGIWRGVSGGIILAGIALVVAALIEPGVFGPRAIIEFDYESIAERLRKAAEDAWGP